MRPFNYQRATETGDAIKNVTANQAAKFLAGGTNLLDLMKEGVENPAQLVDIYRLNLSQIKATTDGGVSIGALARNSDTANHPLIRQNFPLLSQTILAGASAQLRNMATNGGNLMQRTRCTYFYDVASRCNKREPGTGCDAIEGVNRIHAVLGWSDKCIATYPGDMANALYALDATIKVQNAAGQTRSMAITDFHRLPGDTPQIDNNLQHGELITAIELPKNNFAAKSYYLKVRDRASYAFALVAVAVALETDNQNNVKAARVVLGSVAHKPWRSVEAEKALIGNKAADANFKQAAELAFKDAKGFEHNNYKIELGKRAVVRALQRAVNNAV